VTKIRFWKRVRNAKSYLGADVGAHHNPDVAKVCIILNKVQKAKPRKQWDREKLEMLP